MHSGPPRCNTHVCEAGLQRENAQDNIYVFIAIYMSLSIALYVHARVRIGLTARAFTKTKKTALETGSRANNTLQVSRSPHREAHSAECVLSAPWD